MAYVDIPAQFRKLILSTDVYNIVGNRVYYPDRPQVDNFKELLPCIIISRIGGIEDTEMPITTEVWSVLIQVDDEQEKTATEIDQIMRVEVARAIAPNFEAPGILAVRKQSGPFTGKDEDTGIPTSLSLYQVRAALSI